MIPIRDNIRPRRFPLVNYAFIGLNILIFLYQVTLGPEGALDFVYTFGVIPENITNVLAGDLFVLGPASLFPLISATFLHGGWLHLIGNMLYLWVFGDNIEDCLGSINYLMAYVLMGVVASLGHIISNPLSPIPLIGASGAIAGVLGAYFILYPWAKVVALIPLGFFFTFVEIPAMIYLLFWFLLQIFNSVLAQVGDGAQMVAWWAHVGGFISGLVVGIVIKKLGLRVC
ncbi:rhomboid family intramembrane serine protease [Candidatus Contubernalis alkaliaceticus]|uniref:rhomboid family intramembrane serine protease n=1 Tax=Candidatus Contubernalis alkaliaceticus TaxID=338645 RepID=UPI001F4C449E|nr:rhomboid family intramembrane serine protease [Candidatus Contubernalis alkalaceticus]UNC93445.1 rhomboid family intramembrane serine protease [Candidatus Contubernalis alkalaceticus]